MASIAPPLNAAPLKTDAAVISLVGFAHGSSHFFHLMLPTLYPWFIKDFGVSFTEAGALMTVFFVISGIGQALAGIWVDRFGAHRVLCAGLALLALSGLCVFFATTFASLFVAAIVAGLGNSVFHPADFALINRRVSSPRLGHAFSVHGLSGNLGWAASPILLTFVAAGAGWRIAGLVAAAFGAAALLIVLWNYRLLRYETQHSESKRASAQSVVSPRSTWSLLKMPLVWIAFAFFFFSTLGFGALQNFAPTLLGSLYGLSISTATSALSIYLVGGSLGLLAGGFLVQENKAFEYTIAGALCSGAAIAFLLSASVLPSWLVVPLMGAMGFGVGLAGPSRDMLVRKSTKAQLGESAFGRVYGFVYSGLDVGLALAPIAFGFLLDQKLPAFVFVGIGLALLCAIVAALLLARTNSARAG
jgi:MFS transporter, FSR family, fosmidomycin resistance protein